MRFVDVGANLGYFSVLASRLVGPTGQVVAVEPGERSGAVLRANLWRHGCLNTVVVPTAAWYRMGHVQFEINPDGGSGRLGDPYERRGEATVVAAAALDDVLEGPLQPFVKTHAQGADHSSAGHGGTLAMSPDAEIVVEFLRPDPPQPLRRPPARGARRIPRDGLRPLLPRRAGGGADPGHG